MASKFWVPLVVTGCISGTGGNPRLTVGSTAGLLTGTVVIIAAVGGVTGVNGTQTVSTVVDATHFEITGTFGGAYTSGGTVAGGNWTSSSSANWSLTTGPGTPGSAAPVAGDSVTFDGNSGGGTVTVASTFNTGNSLNSITWGAFTGTLDFSVNNPSVALTSLFSGAGTGARTFNAGTGTWTITAGNGLVWNIGTITNLTNPTTAFANSTIVISSDLTTAHTMTFAGGGLTYNNFTMNGNPNGDGLGFTGNNTFNTVTIGAPMSVGLGNTTQTIANLVFSGGSASALTSIIGTAAGNPGIITLTNNSTTGNYVAFRALSLSSTGSITSVNSWDLGANTNTSTGIFNITPPTGGGGIIGG